MQDLPKFVLFQLRTPINQLSANGAHTRFGNHIISDAVAVEDYVVVGERPGLDAQYSQNAARKAAIEVRITEARNGRNH